MKNPSPLINDEQTLVGAKSRFGYPIRTYDEGWGQLWIHLDSMGISGIVRADTCEDAYSICEDEFFPEADETIDEIRKEYNFRRVCNKIIRRKGYAETKVAELDDYPMDEKGWEFVRWETMETPGLNEDGTGDADVWVENELFQESYGFRPNGPNARDTIKHGIYAKDLNGDLLEVLTPKLLEDLEITLEINNNE